MNAIVNRDLAWAFHFGQDLKNPKVTPDVSNPTNDKERRNLLDSYQLDRNSYFEQIDKQCAGELSVTDDHDNQITLNVRYQACRILQELSKILVNGKNMKIGSLNYLDTSKFQPLRHSWQQASQKWHQIYQDISKFAIL